MSEASLLEHIERATADRVTASVIWLHGLGADGNDFVPVVDELQQTAPLGVRFIFPHAPTQPVTVNGGMSMRAWYDIRGLGDGVDEDEAGIRTAHLQIEALLQRELERGIAPERLVLAGFSQGAATALHTALQTETPIGGVIALSGWLATGTSPDQAPARPPVLMAHGTQDPIVPIGLGRYAAQALKEAGFQVEWHEYAMEHAVCVPEIQALDAWLARHLPG